MTTSLRDPESVFWAALNLKSPAERAKYLDQACGDDASLRAEVDALLADHPKVARFLEQPAIASGEDLTLHQPLLERPGTVIGPYKLVEQIGEGGFGVVFMAQQTEPVKRLVALKVVKPGMDSRQVIARFEAERQALALMDHVNIARVLDGGATENGRPYFVMELVHGVPITNYCDDNQLTLRQRLALFLPVCQAIQHAHQKGIIHRDIKPSNVMVTLYDGKPVAKVIDFGVAKATEQKLTERTLFTQYGTLVGTLEYMSPEQAETSALGVDTRSDIYSLGVLLYELLTGSTPLTHRRMKEAAYGEILRMIKEEEPQKPSTRVSESGQALASISAQRRMEPAKLAKLIRGELDWIVMKTLEKNRNRRYEAASALAIDLQHYLNDEPVIACPPSAVYRLRKFVWRNARSLATAALLLILFLILVAGIPVLAILRMERDWARAQKTRAQRAEQEARVLLHRAQAAERGATIQSHLLQATKHRRSGERGQRFEALAEVQKAAGLEPNAEMRLALRNEAIACLALTDVRTIQKLEADNAAGSSFDVNLERYAISARDGTISLRRLADNQELHRLAGPAAPRGERNPALSRFSPDGRFLTAVHSTLPPGLCRVWDLDRRAVICEVPGGGYPDISADGRRVAIPQQDGAIYFYELPTGAQLKRLEVRALPKPNRVRFHPQDGQRFAASGVNGADVFLCNLNTGDVERRLHHNGKVYGYVWNLEGTQLAVGWADSAQALYETWVWDVATGQRRTILEGHRAEASPVGFNRTGDMLATSSWDNTTRLWDAGGRQVFSVPTGGWGGDLGFAARLRGDGRRLAITDPGAVVIHEVVPSRECRAFYGHRGGKGPYAVQASANGQLLVAASDDGVRLWDLVNGRELAHLKEGVSMWAFFDPADDALFTTGKGRLRRWPLTTNPRDNEVRVGPPVTQCTSSAAAGFFQACASLDGKLLAAIAAAGEILVVDRKTGTRKVLRDGRPSLSELRISPDGKWLASAAYGLEGLKLWNLEREEPVIELNAAATPPAFSPDGKRLLTYFAGRLVFWNVGSWKPGLEITADRPRGNPAFSPDGTLLAVTYPNRVQLLDSATGRHLATLEMPAPVDPVTPAFTPDGAQLAVACQSQVIQLWDLRLIRQQLAAMGLDWELPDYPPADTNHQRASPLRVTVLTEEASAGTEFGSH
ncbi:MAG: serine/threonine-protein kinase [Planctomycetaceae bacterium]|nr:serine/threonine-protein kinase [Planctomycetaceae bacterium]